MPLRTTSPNPVAPPKRFARMLAWVLRLSFRVRLLGAVWLLFAVLVALHIHGSSIALSAKMWAPQQADTHYLAQPILKALDGRAPWLRDFLMVKPQAIRSDEWAISSMWSLSQFTHQPRFPVHNTNIGNGQNMLLISWVPVLHPASFVRPVTWGYLLFGSQAGLAWLWWFSPFFCFTMLYLALEIVFPGHRFLPILGAFWFCASAYPICWSHFPAYTVGFAAMVMIGVHHLIAARSLPRALLAALVAGYAAAGFVMQLYPPWQVPLAYTFTAMLAGTIVRDRTWRGVSPRQLSLTGACAASVAVGLIGLFLLAVWPELQALAASAYPGRRRLNGGDYTLAQLFGAVYNFRTTRTAPIGSAVFNASESSGFILFLPTVLFAALMFTRARRRLDPVGWALLGLGILHVLYCRFHFPQWLADLMLWSHTQGFRSQIAIGLISIVLSLTLLRPDPEPKRLTRNEWLAVLGVVLATAGFYLWIGASLQHIRNVFPKTVPFGGGRIPVAMQLVTLLIALQALLLLLGKRRIFASLLAFELIVTAGNFNPLSVGFPRVDASPLYKAVRRVVDDDRAIGLNSLWLASGGPAEPLIGTILSTMGGRALTGVHFHPQLSLWRSLDPSGAFEPIYNRYAEIAYFQLPLADDHIKFKNPNDGSFNLYASPTNPLLRQLGVRYALTYAKDGSLTQPTFTRLYSGTDKPFRIWRLPYQND
ncbi:MAG TPA: hypothetical protein VJ801_13140 [Polyangia bacterium]|nr:hypothetical protein [Polyangia bacterium]